MLIAALLLAAADPQIATHAWMTCLDAAVSSLAKSTEPAETVVTAAFGSCPDEETAARDAWLPSYYAAYHDYGDSIADLKHKLREQLTARVLTLRATSPSPR